MAEIPLGRIGLALGAVALARQLERMARRIHLDGRVAIVTGGSRGLGLVIAGELLEQGARVTLVARTAEDLERARERLRARTGRDAHAIAADMTVPGAMRWVADQVAAREGRIDILVNAAGIIQVGPHDNMTRDDYERAMATHFWGPLQAMQAVLPIMRRQGGGRIANIASIGGRIAPPHLLPYVASKFALVGLSDGIGNELAREGIRVTTISPGLMQTGSHINVEVKGRHRAEYAWFATVAAAPLLSMNAERAARRIVRAIRDGERRLTLGTPARLAALAHVLAPGLIADLMAGVSRLLPGLGSDEARSGWQSRRPSLLTRRADRMIAANNELRGHSLAEMG
jgi:NAD(P)-dependent dehydrogenase (short-subunit alcohol dehydrogenase family)